MESSKICRLLKSSVQQFLLIVCFFPRNVFRLIKRLHIPLVFCLVFLPVLALIFWFKPVSVHYDVTAADETGFHSDDEPVQQPSSSSSSGQQDHQLSSSAVGGRVPTFGHLNRSLLLMAFSYHASPVTDLQETLRPLGARIVDWALNAYGCRYFANCKTVDPLMVSNISGRLGGHSQIT